MYSATKKKYFENEIKIFQSLKMSPSVKMCAKHIYNLRKIISKLTETEVVLSLKYDLFLVFKLNKEENVERKLIK